MKLELPYPILLPSQFAEAARRLGISVDDVDRITWETAAYRDGKVFDLMAFEEAFPSDAFEDFTGDKCFPAELLASSFEVPRDPTAMLTPPISEHDRFAADAWVAASPAGAKARPWTWEPG